MPEPYPVKVVDGVFHFTTDHTVNYSARFLEMPLPVASQVAGLVFDFSFFPDAASVTGSSEDHRVAATLFHLIRRFFETDPERILLYICEANDGRHFARQRLFTKWQLLNDHTRLFQLLPIEVFVADPAIVGGLLFQKNHPLQVIIADFLRVEMQLYTEAKG